MSQAPVCLICCKAIAGKVDNKELMQQLSIFWGLIGIDGKARSHHKVCKSCSNDLEELQATQEAWDKLKKTLLDDQKKLLADLSDGLEKRKKNDIPLLEVHKKLEKSLKGP